MTQGRDNLGRFTSCQHYFVWLKDWGGDSSVPNGTFDCSHYECRFCGEEVTAEQHDSAADRDTCRKEDAAEARAEYQREVYG